ncbi:MAG: ABC transporter permease [Candidatus Bathyarchaeota archaeon]|jgi:ABC-2 type transport system permease protein|nr:ABC transporter permease [Candidatus Bathyarchaeota archaeon]
MISGKRILADFKVYSRGFLRNKFGLFFGLIFPVILIMIFGAIFSGGGSGTIYVYAQNHDDGNVSAQYLSAINNTKTLQVITIDNSVNFTEYMAQNSIENGLVIPNDFSSNYAFRQPINLTIYTNPSGSTGGTVLGVLGAINNQFNLNAFGGFTLISISQKTVGSQESYIDYLVPGLIGFAILVNPMFSLVEISSMYKKNKLFKQLSLTPLTKMEWLTSKILWYIVLSAASFLLMTAVGVALFGANINLTVWLIPFLIIGPMLFASLGMLIGTVTKNPETAGVIGNVVTFPMMFLSGTFFPIAFMPEYLQTFAHVLPLFYVVEGLNNVMVYQNYTGAVIDLAVITVITVVVFILAVKLFKWRED